MRSRTKRHRPLFELPTQVEFEIGGFIGSRIYANQRDWLMVAPVANPAMLTMFRDRDSITKDYPPSKHLIWWSGEFAGKYLISGVQGLRLTKDPHLRAMLSSFVTDLISYQAPDGYLGPFEREQRMDGHDPLGNPLWDLWGQYHCLLGLYYWYKETGDSSALSACRRAADLFCQTFLDSGKVISTVGEPEKNLACAHILTLLYQEVGDPRYLRLVREIELAWVSVGGNYVSGFQNGEAFFQGKMQRWESLHNVQAVVELYFITGDQKYRHAFTQIWRSILSTDRHNTGGFSSFEAASGNPFDPRPIETCATIAWMALTLDMLRLTGESRAADEMEMSTWNAVLGAQNPDGRWWTYNTPMGGVRTDTIDVNNIDVKYRPTYLGERKPAVYDIGWQGTTGVPYLSCCAANGPRGLGILSEWAVMTAPDGIVLNYYGPSEFVVSLPSGRNLRLIQDTNYPVTGNILLRVMTETDEHFTLRLRIPYWSLTTLVKLNGEPLKDVVPGTYLMIARVWKSTDILELMLDTSLHYWVGGPRPTNARGENETGVGAVGKISIYHGPVLLAYDPRYDKYDPTHLPSVTQSNIPPMTLHIPGPIHPLLQLQIQLPIIDWTITLCDFASAGAATSAYPVGRPDINKLWQFGRTDGSIIAEEILLLFDGTIAGYNHPNETGWRFEGDTLVFFAQDGRATTRFTWLSMESGRMILRGFFANRQITHVLQELDPEVIDKNWQFGRVHFDGTVRNDVVLNELMQLHPDGTLSGSSHSNETRWGFSGGKLVFYAQDGKVSTRFSRFSAEHGRMYYQGSFMFDPSITHFLWEMDLEVTNKIWQFARAYPHPDINIRLLSDGTIDGSDHPNETRWGWEANTLVFYAADGRVSTRFTSIKNEGGLMRRSGNFEFNREIQHSLLERNIDLGWGLKNPYVSWLNAPDKTVLVLTPPPSITDI